MKRLARLVFVVPLALVLALSGSPLLPGAGDAAAQERPRTIMDMLFGAPTVRRRDGDAARPRRIERQKDKPRRTKPSRSAKARGAATARPADAAAAGGAAAPVEKSATARTVLVVGDFMASSLAGGLTEAAAANAGVTVASAADGSSGLVRADHFDWVAKIGPMVDERKPSVVVVMLGSNDRQPITAGSSALALRSPEWTAEYGRRADALAAAVKEKNVPLVWVGMPSFKFERMSEDMAFFNEIYRKASASVGGDYVEVWDGFVDAGGAFTYSGPDIAGQQARLRNADGITMTPEGAEKLAFFAQKPIFRILGTSASPDLASLAPGGTPAPDPAARPANATFAPVVALSDPALDGGETLLGGGAGAIASAEPSPRERLVVSGEPGATPAGRADNFNWSGKTPAVSPLRGTNDVISRGSVELQDLRKAQGIRPPKDMPSLSDAIIADWEAQNAADAASEPPAPASTPASAAVPSVSAPAAAAGAAEPPPAPARPISASPFPAEQKPI